MFRNMVTSLLKHDKIKTTTTRAKEIRGWADYIITLAKRGDLHARRQALAIVREKDVVHKLFEEASTRFSSIAGGYTRIIKVGRRPGDAAPMSIVELVAESITSAQKKKSSTKSKATAEKEKLTSLGKSPDETAKTADASNIEVPKAVESGENEIKKEETT